MAYKKQSPRHGGVSRAYLNGLDQLYSPNHSTESPADKLIGRLDGVKSTGPDRWIARCPAHDDRTPSLSIRETADGTLLLKDWAGCSAADIVAAVGLDLSDLFPARPEDRSPLRPGERWIPRDVLKCCASEAMVAVIACEDMRNGKRLSDADAERLALAESRLRNAAEEVGCYVR